MTSSAFDVDGPLSRMLAAEGSPSSSNLLNELKATNTLTGEIEAEQRQKEAAQRPNEAELRYTAVRTSQYAQGLVLRQKERAQDEAEEALAAVGAVAAFAGGAPQSLASSNLATLHKVNPTPAPAASPKTTQPGARRASAAEHVDNFGVQSRVSREDEQAKRAEQRLNERMEAMRLGVDGDDGTEDMLRRSAGLAVKGDGNALSATDPPAGGGGGGGGSEAMLGLAERRPSCEGSLGIVESFTPDSMAPPSRKGSPVGTRGVGSPNRSPLPGRRGPRSPSSAFAGAKPATEPAAPTTPAASPAVSTAAAPSSPATGTPSFSYGEGVEHQLALLVERLRSLRAAGLLAEPTERRLHDVVGDCATLGALAAAFPRDDAALAKQLSKCFK